MELTENELKQKREFIKAQAKKERNKKQYEKSKEECIICDTCARKVSKYYTLINILKHLDIKNGWNYKKRLKEILYKSILYNIEMPPKNEPLIFNGKEMIATTKSLISYSKIKATTITTKKTRDNIKNGDNASEMEPLNYVQIQNWVKTNKARFMTGYSKAQINVLTSKGWRAGLAFDTNGEISWFSAKQQYNEAMYDITTVYAVQILLF